jgi:hypothetical protein
LFHMVVVPWLACVAAFCIVEIVIGMVHAPLPYLIFRCALLAAS